MMQIIIPTRGRIEQQLTLQSLPPELRKRTTLVCPENEAVALSYEHPDVEIVVEPYPKMKIAQTREWIVQTWFRYGYAKIIMLDDDLVFATRISAGDWHLRPIEGEELIPEFQRIEDKLGPAFPHAGFGVRQGNHLEEAGWKIPGRMCHTLAYYLPIAAKEARFDVIALREDFAFTLQLLLKGYPNAVWMTTVANQVTDAPGGCSTYRDQVGGISNDAEAEKLAALFPGYVCLRNKDYKARDEIVDQRLHHGGVLGRAFNEPERVLHAVAVDADRCHQHQFAGHVDAVDLHNQQVELGQVL
jgi:hypothetical protein